MDDMSKVNGSSVIFRDKYGIPHIFAESGYFSVYYIYYYIVLFFISFR